MADNRLFVATKPTSLKSSVVVGQTDATVGEIKDRQGDTLTMANFGTEGYGVVNPNKKDEEHFVFTGITGSKFTGVSNVIMKSPYTRTSGFLSSHASGVRVIIYSNTPAAWDSFANKENDETIAETWTFTGTNLPRVDSYIAPTLDVELAAKKYIDDVAIAGSPDMTTTVKGIAEEATQAEIDADTGAGGTAARLAVNPSTLATSKYGTRLPSADEKAALAGTAGSPSASNLYLTEEDNDRLAIFAESSDGSDSYTATTTPAITSTNGTVVYLTVDTANTGSCSFDLNGEGSAQITYGNGTAPPTGSIKASDTLHLVKSGTRWVLQTPPKYHVDGSIINEDTTSAVSHDLRPRNQDLTDTHVEIRFDEDIAVTAFGAPAQNRGQLVNRVTTGGGDCKIEIEDANIGDWDDNHVWDFVLQTASSDNQNILVGLGYQTGDEIIDPAGIVRHAGFFIEEAALKASIADGTTQETTTITGITITNFNRYRIEFDAGSEVRFYVNGTLEATLSTNVPSGTTSYSQFVIGIDETTTANRQVTYGNGGLISVAT